MSRTLESVIFYSAVALIVAGGFTALFYASKHDQNKREACEKECHPYEMSFCNSDEVGCYTNDPSVIKRVPIFIK